MRFTSYLINNYITMSEFAKRELEKYGWTQGKGLGKQESGIVKPIRTVLKFDHHGIGHDDSKVWTSRWWCNIFNDASKRISVINNETGVQVHCEKKVVESKLPSDILIHKNFLKSSTSEDWLSLNEAETGQTLPHTLREDLIYRKCDGIKRKCFNYDLVKGKINRTNNQEDKFLYENKSKRASKKKRKRKK